MIKLNIVPPIDVLPTDDFLAGAIGRGIHNLTVEHFRARNQHNAGTRVMPKSNYYQDAAESTSVQVDKSTAIVSVDKEGIALHYYGGTVLPKKKALAIPLSPIVAGIWPSEAPGNLDLFWPKNSSHGFLKDSNSSEILYLLVPKVTIRADKNVLPTDEEYYSAAQEAILEAMS